jgi:hypothetical protein
MVAAGLAIEHAAGVSSTEPTTATRRLDCGKAIRKAATITFFVLLPAVWTVGWLEHLLTVNFDHRAGFDLRFAFLPAAHAVIHGHSPYLSPNDPGVASQIAYVYPPVVAFLTSPLLLLPIGVAIVVGTIGSLLLVPALLAAAGVRDWRCYGLALLWAPVFNAVQNVSISLPLAFLLAVAWRYRGSQRVSGVVLGCFVAAKLFVWPLLVWPIALRRWRALVTGIGVAAVLAIGSWAVIGFKGFAQYPRLMSALTSHEETQSYSVSAALRVLGLGAPYARGIAVVLTLALLAACLSLGRRGDEKRAFSAAILAALTSTPILWQHYLVLLLVALAVARPRASLAWCLPIALWFVPFTGDGNWVQTLLVPLVAAIVGAACLLPDTSAARVGSSMFPSVLTRSSRRLPGSP